MLASIAEREQTRGVSRRKARASREQWNLFQLPRRRRVSHAFACKVTQFFRDSLLFYEFLKKQRLGSVDEPPSQMLFVFFRL